jgi:hypothetical protein
MIKMIWDITLELWKERNDQINKQDNSITAAIVRERLEYRVQRCYELKDKLRHQEKLQWFSDSKDELLNKDTRHIESWIRTVTRIIRITKREAKKRPRESILMEKFFSRDKPVEINTHRQRQEASHPSRFPQELKPD